MTLIAEDPPEQSPSGSTAMLGVNLEAEVEAELQRIVPKNFSVGCPKTAAWVVRKIVESRTYAQAVEKWAETERRRARLDEERLVFLFGGQLRSWAEAEIAKVHGRRRSISLPSGIVGFRAMPSRLIIQDETRLMKWARTNCPSAIVMSERLVKTPLADHMKSTGEIPDGAAVLEPRDEFYIR